MFRPQGFLVAASAFALLAWTASADAQQSGATRNQLMFDPNGVQGGADSRTGSLQSSPTTGQSVAPQKPTAPVTAQTAAPQRPAAPAAKPAAAPKPPAAPATAGAPPQARPQTARRPAETAARAATDAQRTSERPIPREQPQALGRVSLPGATLGYENKTQLQSYDLSDGRRVPGYDNIQRNDSSYFGLSLRMPTSSSSGSSMFGRHGVD